MTHSKPNLFRMTLGMTMLFILVFFVCILIIEWTTEALGLNNFAEVILAIGTILGGVVFIRIELPVMVSLTINNDRIIVRNFLTGRVKEVLLTEIHSFKISINATPRRIFYELILLRHGDPLEIISLSYMANLNQIIEELEKHLRNLTEDEHGILRLLRKSGSD